MNHKLTMKNIIGYGLGDVANNFAFGMGSLFLLNYYTDVVGISAVAAGTMLLLVRIFDAGADIAVGMAVDRTVTRWGKFRPYLIGGAIPLMIFSVLVFSVPESWSSSSQLGYMYATYMGLGVCYSLVNIPYGSLSTAMTQDPASRARLGSARTLMAAMTYVFLAYLIGDGIKNANGNNQHVYTTYTAILAVLGFFLYLVCFNSTRENVVRIVSRPSARSSLKTLFKNGPVLMLCLAAFCVLSSNLIVNTITIYYVQYVFNDTSKFVFIISIQSILAAVIGSLVVPFLINFSGKKKTFLLGTLFSAGSYVSLYFLNELSMLASLIALGCASVGASIAMTTMWALESDTVEYGEYKTNIRIEGLNYSTFSFFRKLGQAAGSAIPAYLLGAYGYVANQPQTPDVADGIKLIISLLPGGFMGISFIIMIFYPLTDTRFMEIIKLLDKRKKEQSDFISNIREV